VFRGQDGTFVGGHFSGNAEHGNLADLEMKVGGSAIDDGGKKEAEIRGGGHKGYDFQLYTIT
jgi:hypothetical protein